MENTSKKRPNVFAYIFPDVCQLCGGVSMTCLIITALSTLCAPPPAAADWPVLLTVYDTALCTGQPCLQGNGDGRFASMIPVSPEWYHRMAACPPQFFGRWVEIPAVGLELYCGDSFGSLDGRPVETAVCQDGGCYFRIDVFYPVAEFGLPSWNYWTVSADWGLE